MLAGERAAKGKHNIGGAINELAEAANALGAVEVKVDAHVDATLPVVAIERTAEAVLGHEPSDRAQIFSELHGWNGGVLPALPAVVLSGHKARGAQRGCAHMPHRTSLIGRADVRDRRRWPGLRRARQRFSLGVGFFSGPCACLNKQK